MSRPARAPSRQDAIRPFFSWWTCRQHLSATRSFWVVSHTQPAAGERSAWLRPESPTPHPAYRGRIDYRPQPTISPTPPGERDKLHNLAGCCVLRPHLFSVLPAARQPADRVVALPAASARTYVTFGFVSNNGRQAVQARANAVVVAPCCHEVFADSPNFYSKPPQFKTIKRPAATREKRCIAAVAAQGHRGGAGLEVVPPPPAVVAEAPCPPGRVEPQRL